jgi:hypothetical protein
MDVKELVRWGESLGTPGAAGELTADQPRSVKVRPRDEGLADGPDEAPREAPARCVGRVLLSLSCWGAPLSLLSHAVAVVHRCLCCQCFAPVRTVVHRCLCCLSLSLLFIYIYIYYFFTVSIGRHARCVVLCVARPLLFLFFSRKASTIADND